MNTFQQYIGKQITKVMSVEFKEDEPYIGECIAVILVLEQKGALEIFFDSSRKITRLEYLSVENLEDLVRDFETERVVDEDLGDRLQCIVVPDSTRPLHRLQGQTLQSLQFWQAELDTAASVSFVIKDGKYAGVLIKTEHEKVVMFSTLGGGQILFDTEELPGIEEGWSLR